MYTVPTGRYDPHLFLPFLLSATLFNTRLTLLSFPASTQFLHNMVKHLCDWLGSAELLEKGEELRDKRNEEEEDEEVVEGD